MGHLNDVMSTWDAAAFVDTDHFGETVNYKTKAGIVKAISANIWRNPPQQRDGVNVGSGPHMIVYIRNDATDGVTEINTGGDAIEVAYRLGEDPEYYLIHGPVTQDAGIWHIELS